jgi:hypothetical protein
MQETPEDKMIRERLMPGQISPKGFLGTDERPVEEIIAADTAEVEAAGLTTVQLGELLEEIHQAADQGWESTVSLYDGRITARSLEVNGKIPCPFGCGAKCHKAVIEVNFCGTKIQFTPLDAHMIQVHGFFEGKGSDYRLNPRDIIEIFKCSR